MIISFHEYKFPLRSYQTLSTFIHIHTHTHTHFEHNCDSDTKRFSSILYKKKQILKPFKIYFNVHALSDHKRGVKDKNPKLLKCFAAFSFKVINIINRRHWFSQNIWSNKLVTKELKVKLNLQWICDILVEHNLVWTTTWRKFEEEKEKEGKQSISFLYKAWHSSSTR